MPKQSHVKPVEGKQSKKGQEPALIKKSRTRANVTHHVGSGDRVGKNLGKEAVFAFNTRTALAEFGKETLIAILEWFLKERSLACDVTLLKLLLRVPCEVRYYPFDWQDCIPIKNMLEAIPALQSRFVPSSFPDDNVWRLLSDSWGIILAEPSMTKKRLLVEELVIRGQSENKKRGVK